MPNVLTIRKMASIRPKSPMTLTTKALLAAATAAGRVYQKPMSRNDARPDVGPADEQEEEVIRRDQQRHREDEEIEEGEEAPVAGVIFHVADGIDVDEEADAGHDQQHHRRERVGEQAERESSGCQR